MIVIAPKDHIKYPEHWNYYTSGNYETMSYSMCRETCSGDMSSLCAYQGGKVPDITVDIGNILSERRPKLTDNQANGLNLLSYTLSELVLHQEEFKYLDDAHDLLTDLRQNWWSFNAYGTVRSLDENIRISLDEVDEFSGAITNLPFKYTRYRALMSFLMAVPRAFERIAERDWLYLGHAEPTHQKAGHADKLWTDMYAGLGNALHTYKYTRKYWWTFLHMLIINLSQNEGCGLLNLMNKYSGRNGVRSFVGALKRDSRLPTSSLYYYRELSKQGFFKAI